MSTKIKKGWTFKQPDATTHGVRAWWQCTVKASKIDYYIVDWEYALTTKNSGKDFVWTSGGAPTYTPTEAGVTESNKSCAVTWTVDSSALAARVRIMPVSKTYTKNKEEKKYFTGAWSAYKSIDFRTNALTTPSISVSINSDTNVATFTVTANDDDARTCEVKATCGTASKHDKRYTLVNGGYTGTVTVAAGQTWAFAACTRSSGDKATSSWSTAASVTAKPAGPSLVDGSAKAYGTDGIQFSWKAVTGAASYTVEYVADSADYFKTNRSAVQSVSGITGTTFQQTGLETGHVYYMRVQAVNATNSGAWSNASAGVSLATVPDAPTTYDTYPSYKLSDTVKLKWTHNSEDNSTQTYAQVKLTVGSASATFTVTGDASEYEVDLSSVSGVTVADGSSVSWCVRTKGAHESYGDWSGTRSFGVYDVPVLVCTLSQDGSAVDASNPLSALPLAVELDASGGGNAVSGYHVTVTAHEALEKIAPDGTTYYVAAGDVVYEKDYVTDDDPYEAEIGIEAGLPDACTLDIVADVSMQAGLRATSEKVTFAVDFASDVPEPTCIVDFDKSSLTATVTGVCYELDEDGIETDDPYDGVTLSIYRIESDGSLTLLADDMPNTGSASVVDPHPSFGTCSYRVVATDTTTGMSNYCDGDEESKHHTCVVQWDESWDEYGEDDYVGLSYTGSMIDGLYNCTLDESGGMQSEDVEYIGRTHPVSYYGTQRGHSASYQVEFPKSDTETLAKARRLIAYAGDAYVREPSGLGFWAHVSNPRISRGYDSQAVKLSFDAVHVDHAEGTVG